MRKPLTISYRVLDEDGRCVEVFKKTGLNRRYLQWIAERYVKNKYGKGKKLHQFKVVEEEARLSITNLLPYNHERNDLLPRHLGPLRVSPSLHRFHGHL